MGAKFIVDRRCTVKTSLTLTGLIEGLKRQTLLRRITDLTAAGALPDYDGDSRLDLILLPETGLPGDLTIRDLREHASGLAEHRHTCRQCSSSLSGHVGGCIAYVPYPISEGMEYLLWLTAARALEQRLPDGLLPRALSFAQRACSLGQTPFSDTLRMRGDLLGLRARMHHQGLFRRQRLSSAQVLDAFFVNGVLGGDDLRIHEGFLTAALAMGRALEPALDEGRREALLEDVEPYGLVSELMSLALEQGIGVYVWP